MHHRYAAMALVAAASLSACAKPPAEAIALADEARQGALSAGAEEYAPEALNAVSEAKAALDAEIAAQGEKMSLTRSYKHAEELAMEYQTAADQATAAATTAKNKKPPTKYIRCRLNMLLLGRKLNFWEFIFWPIFILANLLLTLWFCLCGLSFPREITRTEY